MVQRTYRIDVWDHLQLRWCSLFVTKTSDDNLKMITTLVNHHHDRCQRRGIDSNSTKKHDASTQTSRIQGNAQQNVLKGHNLSTAKAQRNIDLMAL